MILKNGTLLLSLYKSMTPQEWNIKYNVYAQYKNMPRVKLLKYVYYDCGSPTKRVT